MSISKNSKMVSLLNYRLRITITDGRTLIGQMLAFDRHMNFVLADCEEFRKIKTKVADKPEEKREKEIKRTLGLVILRGEVIVSMSIEAPPPQEKSDKKPVALPVGPGFGRPAGRGVPIPVPGAAPAGLVGPAGGIGAPAPGMMAPPGARPPMMPPPGWRPGMPLPPPRPGMPMPPMPGMMPPRPGMPPMMPPPGFRPGMPVR
ncbi:hypothetical protein BKA69DRAFT_1077292 [Paraphysoderma sedebokerense]|nr:hypothetical protein BKA69DRAFT_1077292 [Paraphysoderma sedebokerense]